MYITTTESPEQNLVDLLNSLNPSAHITTADVSFGTPAEVSATSSVPQTTPTTVQVNGAGSYEGSSVQFNYNRVDINFALDNNQWNGNNLPTAQTANFSVTGVVNVNWGVDTDSTTISKTETALGLVPGQITATQNIANVGQFNHLVDYGVMANPDSLLYVGNSDVLLNWVNYMPPFNGMSWITNTNNAAVSEVVFLNGNAWVTDGTNMYSINTTTGNISAPVNIVTALSLTDAPTFAINCLDSNGVIWLTLNSASSTDPTIVRFDTTTNTVKDSLFVNPTVMYTNLAFDPVNSVVWALSNTAGTYGVAQLSVTSGAVVNSFPMTIAANNVSCFFVDTVNGNLWLGDITGSEANQVRVISNTGTVLATLANQGCSGICIATNGGTTEIVLTDTNPSTSNLRITRYSSTAYTVTLTEDILNSVFAGLVPALFDGSNVSSIGLQYLSATDEILIVANMSLINGYIGSSSNNHVDTSNGTFAIDRTALTTVRVFYPAILNGQVNNAYIDASGAHYILYQEEWSTFDNIREFWLAKLTS